MTRAEFTKATKLAAFKRANECCEDCGNLITTRAEYDHIVPAAIGGRNDLDNCQCLCRKCHRRKTDTDWPAIARSTRLYEKRAGVRKTFGRWK